MRALIERADAVQALIGRIKARGGYITNFFLDAEKLGYWISFKLLEFEEMGSSIFLFKSNPGFCHLFYISRDAAGLRQDLEALNRKYGSSILVADVVSKDSPDAAGKAFGQAGFVQYSKLIRMSRLPAQHAIATPASGDHLFYADRSMVNGIQNLFQFFFDPFCEQVPLPAEIQDWVDKRQFIYFGEREQDIQGFIVFHQTGKTALLRYWFVHPDHREKGIGSVLINRYFEDCKESQRQIFWVIEENENAIKRYEHYGFRREVLSDCVFINQSLQYEGKNN